MRTTRKKLQLEFMKECIEHGSAEKFMQAKDKRYDKQAEMCETLLKEVLEGKNTRLSYYGP